MKRLLVILALVCVVGCESKDASKEMKKTSTTIGQQSAQSSDKLLAQGMMFLKESKPVEAVQVFRAAIASDPANIQPHMVLAQTFIQINEYDQAVEVLEKATQQFTNEPGIFYMLAVTSSQIGNEVKAAVAARRSYDLYEQRGDKELAARSAGLLNYLVKKAQANKDVAGESK